MEHKRTTKRQLPLTLTFIIGYFIIVWVLMLWTTLYLGVTGKQSFETLITNIRWFNLKILSPEGFLILAGNVAAIYGMWKMKKWSVYVLLATIIAVLLINLYSAPHIVFTSAPLYIKMVLDLIALYIIVPLVAVIVGFKHLKFMK